MSSDSWWADSESVRHQLAHDLTNPVRAIGLYAELMEGALNEAALDPEQLGHYRVRIAEAAEEARLIILSLKNDTPPVERTDAGGTT